jgi:hypothetical protein
MLSRTNTTLKMVGNMGILDALSLHCLFRIVYRLRLPSLPLSKTRSQ